MKKENRKTSHNIETSDSNIEALARCLLPEIQKYFQSAEGKQEFEEWQVKHAQAGKEAE